MKMLAGAVLTSMVIAQGLLAAAEIRVTATQPTATPAYDARLTQYRVPYKTIDENDRSELAATPDSVRGYMRENYFAGQWKPEYEALVEIPVGWMNGPDRKRSGDGARRRPSPAPSSSRSRPRAICPRSSRSTPTSAR